MESQKEFTKSEVTELIDAALDQERVRIKELVQDEKKSRMALLLGLAGEMNNSFIENNLELKEIFFIMEILKVQLTRSLIKNLEKIDFFKAN